MLQNKSFVRKTKKGGVVKVEPAHHCFLSQTAVPPITKLTKVSKVQVVNQHYLRDDIYSGSPLDPDCIAEAYKLSADAAHYLVIDTNLALHQVGPPGS